MNTARIKIIDGATNEAVATFGDCWIDTVCNLYIEVDGKLIGSVYFQRVRDDVTAELGGYPNGLDWDNAPTLSKTLTAMDES